MDVSGDMNSNMKEETKHTRKLILTVCLVVIGLLVLWGDVLGITGRVPDGDRDIEFTHNIGFYIIRIPFYGFLLYSSLNASRRWESLGAVSAYMALGLMEFFSTASSPDRWLPLARILWLAGIAAIVLLTTYRSVGKAFPREL